MVCWVDWPDLIPAVSIPNEGRQLLIDIDRVILCVDYGGQFHFQLLVDLQLHVLRLLIVRELWRKIQYVHEELVSCRIQGIRQTKYTLIVAELGPKGRVEVYLVEASQLCPKEDRWLAA